jgi:hypothetical protein
MAIRQLWIAKLLLANWLCLIVKCSLAIWRQAIAKHMLAILATFYCLNRNDRVSSFYLTRGSKLCFLTCFSYFSCYFHILVFLWNRYLLIFLHLSWLHGNPILDRSFPSRTCQVLAGTKNGWKIAHKIFNGFFEPAHQSKCLQLMYTPVPMYAP